jgi:hypothetical protein
MLKVKKRVNGLVRTRISKEIATRVAGLILAALAAQGWLEGVTPGSLQEHEAELAALLLLVAEIVAQIMRRRREGEEIDQ